MQAYFRFYAELNDHLPAEKARKEFAVSLEESSSVKEMIEAMGVPTGEVDLILVNGESVGLSYRVNDGDRISVYPVFESFDISSVEKIRPQPLRQPRFVLDVHLGKLARYLRMLGFDALYKNNYTGGALVTISLNEKRILLTKAHKLLEESSSERGHLVHEKDPGKQLWEVLYRFDLFNSITPFTRCLECNTRLNAVSKQEVFHRLPPKVQEHFEEFQQCEQCDKIYWKGSHYERMQNVLESVLQHSKHIASS